MRATGFALVLALVVIALTSLAAVALTRAVDLATAVTGSVALRAASIPAADVGVEEAIALLMDPVAVGDGERDVPARAYFASRQPGEDARGIPWLLGKTDRLPAAAPAPDGGEGIALRYVIERLCLGPGPAGDANCTLARRPNAGSAAAAGATPLPGTPTFRITVRVDGPQQTVSLVQVLVAGARAPRRLTWRLLGD